MLFAIVVVLLAQVPVLDPMPYVRAHRDADNALVAGKIAEARAGFASCLEMSPRNATVAYALACTEARAGDKAKSIGWLERAVEWGYADWGVTAWDEDLASVRTNSSLVAALERMRKFGRERGELAQLVEIWDERRTEIACDVSVEGSGRFAVVAQRAGYLQVLDTRTGQELRRSPSLGSAAWALDFDRSGERVAALTWDGNLHLWNIDGKTQPTSVKAIRPPPEPKADSKDGGELGWPFAAFIRFDSSAERVLVAACGRGASLFSAKGELVHAWNESSDYGFSATIIAWSFDGARIAMPKDKAVRFFDGRTGEPVGELLEEEAHICSIAFQPGGTLFATGLRDSRVRVWDLKTSKLAFEHVFKDIFDEQLDVNSVAFSPDGKWIAAGTGERAYLDVLDAGSGVMVSHFDSWGGHFGEPYDLSWMPDSSRLWFAYCCGGMPMNEIAHGNEFAKSVEFSGRPPRFGKSGPALATGLGNVLALDVTSGRCLWDRPILGREGVLLKTSTGHFMADLDSLEGLSLRPPRIGDQEAEPQPLAKFVAVLFDPKRVRAARDGVAIVPVKFD